MPAITKTRFCPSPTGYIHLGNTRTALFNALFARANKGTFLLRIEDTDRERSDEKYTVALMEDLEWLGLDWQEGPDVGGDHGPYHQCQRQSIYDEYYEKIQAKGLAYPCFCTEQELALSRKIQLASNKPPRYAGTCRNLTHAQIEAKFAEGRQATLRFKIPHDETITFTDLVRGEQRFQTNDLGDFIIRRTNGTPPFMFCNAIDDALMGVTHALRGEDHLTNTPRQIMILQALDLTPPQYGHISLITGPDGAPLSKRHGSENVQTMRNKGFLRLAIINYLARLGHYYADDSLMHLDALAQKFNTKHLGTAPAHFDAHQLLHWQKLALAQLDKQAFWDWLGSAIQTQVPTKAQADFIDTVKPNVVFPPDADLWAKICFQDNLSIDTKSQAILQQAGANFFATAIKAWQEKADYQHLTTTLKAECNVKGKNLFAPLRVALTGVTHGPELVKLLHLIDDETVIARFEAAKSLQPA